MMVSMIGVGDALLAVIVSLLRWRSPPACGATLIRACPFGQGTPPALCLAADWRRLRR